MKDMIRFETHELHTHYCPVCSYDRSCMMDCAICDGEEGEPLRGSTVVCRECAHVTKVCSICEGVATLAVPPGVKLAMYTAQRLAGGAAVQVCDSCQGAGFVRFGGYDGEGVFTLERQP